MPINRLLLGSKLGQHEIAKLNEAYASALRSLHLTDRNDPICEIVARKVIEIGRASTDDQKEIAALAVKQLGIPS